MTIIFYFSCFAYGTVLALLGYSFTTWQFWVMGLIFLIAVFTSPTNWR